MLDDLFKKNQLSQAEKNDFWVIINNALNHDDTIHITSEDIERLSGYVKRGLIHFVPDRSDLVWITPKGKKLLGMDLDRSISLTINITG